MVDYSLLGFLLYGDMTGYDIKRCMSMSTANFYEASFGSIYPSLRKLEQCAWVTMKESAAGGKLRKTYSVTEAGKKAFRQWLTVPPDISKGPSVLLLKLFFLGTLTAPEAEAWISSAAAGAAARLSWLKDLSKAPPAEADFFQLSTMRFGAEYYAFLEAWLKDLGRRAKKAAGDTARRGGDDERRTE
jgi:DNA-binding PadR family transcriptional regulator